MDTEKKVQFVALTKEEIDAMIQQAALAGAQVASDAMMVGQRKSEKEKIDRRLHNTDLLLRNYRTLKASYENAVYKSKEGEVTEVLEDIMTMKDDKVIVESIKTSAKRTAIMVQHIDKMLDVYRIYCSKLSEKDKRRYKIIKALYISKDVVDQEILGMSLEDRVALREKYMNEVNAEYDAWEQKFNEEHGIEELRDDPSITWDIYNSYYEACRNGEI